MMERKEILDGFARVYDDKQEWKYANSRFKDSVEFVHKRLLYEAVSARIGERDVAKAMRVPVSEVRRQMRALGLNPRRGQRLLSQQASDALHKNAKLMGIDPSAISLTSPLAYLPGGSQLRDIVAKPSTVRELPEGFEEL